MIKITVGDSVTLAMIANKDAVPFSLLGAVFETHLLDNKGAEIIIPNSSHLAAADQTGVDKGKFTLTLGSVNTAQLNTGPSQTILTKIVQGASILSFRGIGILTVYSDKLSD